MSTAEAPAVAAPALTDADADSAAAPRRRRSSRVKEALFGYALLVPAVVILGVFAYYPLYRLVHFALYRPNRFGRGEVYVGPSNITRVLGGDEFKEGLWITVKFLLYTVPTGLVLGVLLALAAHRHLRGIKIFQGIFSSTVATSVAVASVVFFGLVNPKIGKFGQVGLIDLSKSSSALRGVAADTLDDDVPAVARRHRGAGPEPELIHRHAGHVVDAEHRIAGKLVEQPVLHHGARAGVAAFLGRLEDEHHRAIKITMRRQILRGAQQHRRVPIVAAAVHAPADRGLVGKPVVLRHRQRIHVGAQADGLAAAAGAQNAHYTGFPQPRVDFQSPAAQTLGHQVGSARFLKRQFGMGMDIAPQRSQVPVYAFDFGNGFHGCG